MKEKADLEERSENQSDIKIMSVTLYNQTKDIWKTGKLPIETGSIKKGVGLQERIEQGGANFW